MKNSPLNHSLSASVQLYRKAKHMSAEECAKELGVSKTALLNIERQQANPTLETVDIIAKNMGTSPLSLLGDSGASRVVTSLFLMNFLEDGHRFSLDTLQQAAEHLQAALDLLCEDLLSHSLEAETNQEQEKQEWPAV